MLLSLPSVTDDYRNIIFHFALRCLKDRPLVWWSNSFTKSATLHITDKHKCLIHSYLKRFDQGSVHLDFAPWVWTIHSYLDFSYHQVTCNHSAFIFVRLVMSHTAVHVCRLPPSFYRQGLRALSLTDLSLSRFSAVLYFAVALEDQESRNNAQTMWIINRVRDTGCL